MDDQHKARMKVRGILHGARGHVLIVDSYFDASVVHGFLHALSSPAAEVRILASADELWKTGKKGEESVRGGDALLRALDAAKASGLRNSISVRVTEGSSESHDRFLQVDGNIWFLGNSLNAFGTRLTTMRRASNPAHVLAVLESKWAAGTDLSEFLRRKLLGEVPLK